MNRSSGWENVNTWYDQAVGDKGHYYHENIVIPGVLRLLDLGIGDVRDSRAQGRVPDLSTTGRTTPKTSQKSILDLACGQGILARALPKSLPYIGLDASSSLINHAKNRDKNPYHIYQIADLNLPLKSLPQKFTHATCILALQNIEHPEILMKSATNQLMPQGKFILVINHPAFRIPRQSSWGIDPQNKLQYRRINRYLSPLKIPITTHPGQKHSPITWSFHYPLSSYTSMLKAAGFVITDIEEWSSDKHSLGKAAKMENASRAEIPLFLAIAAQKSQSQ